MKAISIRIKRTFTILLMLIPGGMLSSLQGQVVIGQDGNPVANSAMLEVKSLNSGVLLPRMTDQQATNIVNPATGLIIYNLDAKKFQVYNGTSWMQVSTSTSLWQCGEPLLDERDGHIYPTIQIGSRCWMKANMNIGSMIAGTTVQTNNGIIEKYCYDDNSANCDSYGGLYNWNEMMQYSTNQYDQGICPPGWHIPTDAEWTTLTNSYGGEGEAGGHLKEAGNAHWASPNAADNSSGLTLLPGGTRGDNQSFTDKGTICRIWSSSQYSSVEAWRRGFTYNVIQLLRTTNMKADFGFSVRCISDFTSDAP